MPRLAKPATIAVAVVAPLLASGVVVTIGRGALQFFHDKAPELEEHLPAFSRWVLANAPSIRLAMLAQGVLVLLVAFIIMRRSKTEASQLTGLLLLITGSLVLVIMAFVMCLLAWFLPFASHAMMTPTRA